jgi:hypothetical protein
VVATCLDDAQITGRGKYVGWRKLLTCLDTVDQIVVSNAGDIPGKAVADLLKILATLRITASPSICTPRISTPAMAASSYWNSSPHIVEPSSRKLSARGRQGP